MKNKPYKITCTKCGAYNHSPLVDARNELDHIHALHEIGWATEIPTCPECRFGQPYYRARAERAEQQLAAAHEVIEAVRGRIAGRHESGCNVVSVNAAKRCNCFYSGLRALLPELWRRGAE